MGGGKPQQIKSEGAPELTYERWKQIIDAKYGEGAADAAMNHFVEILAARPDVVEQIGRELTEEKLAR